mgnify:FL=1
MPEGMTNLSKEELLERLKQKKFRGVKAPSDSPIYSRGWQVGSAPVFRTSTTASTPNDSDKGNQPHPGLVPPIDPNAIEEREVKNPDGSDLDEFIAHYSPALARQEELERGEE